MCSSCMRGVCVKKCLRLSFPISSYINSFETYTDVDDVIFVYKSFKIDYVSWIL